MEAKQKALLAAPEPPARPPEPRPPVAHCEAREAGPEVAAGREALPGMEAALGKGARLRQRRQRARVADLVTGRRQHNGRVVPKRSSSLQWVGWGREQEEEGRNKWEEDTKCP